MSNLKAEVTLPWGDGEYTFRLTVNGLIELEQKCGSPFTVILQRLNAGEYGINDVRETIRLGLVGGGMASAKAVTLVKQYVDEPGRIAEHTPVARLVLGAVLFGFEVAPLGNQEAAPTEETSPIPSTPPAFTAPPRSSVSPLKSLIASRSGNSRLQ